MPTINFFVFYASLFNCGPFRNSIQLWCERGYKVNVFQPADKRLHQYSSELDRHYQLKEIKFPNALETLSRGIGKGMGLLRYFKLRKLALSGNQIDYIIRSLHFIFSCRRLSKTTDRQICIGGDPQGLLAAYLIARRNIDRNLLIYWSLELWIEKDIRSLARLFFKKLEKWCNQRAFCTIEFGEQRCALLKVENNLPEESMIPIPNSPIGETELHRHTYFNKIFDIAPDKKIILYAGGISRDHMLGEIIDSLDSWPSHCVLVLHFSHHDESNLSELKKKAKHHPGRVYFSLEAVAYDDLEEIYTSCDIGLQFFRPRMTNLKYADWCSGKLFQCMRAGVPVITGNLPGYGDLIEKNGIGLCVSDTGNIGLAVERILEEEEQYKTDCVHTFKSFEFRKHHQKLVKAVEERFPRNESKAV
ncbi:hypothetical protein ACFL4N_00340 [Thermodesulfobacteriota bacterium]